MIQLLLGGVEDINAVALPLESEYFSLSDYKGGTVFDLFACVLHRNIYWRRTPIIDPIVFDLLLSRGAEISRPMNGIEITNPTMKAEFFETETSLLRQIPGEPERKTFSWVS